MNCIEIYNPKGEIIRNIFDYYTYQGRTFCSSKLYKDNFNNENFQLWHERTHKMSALYENRTDAEMALGSIYFKEDVAETQTYAINYVSGKYKVAGPIGSAGVSINIALNQQFYYNIKGNKVLNAGTKKVLHDMNAIYQKAEKAWGKAPDSGKVFITLEQMKDIYYEADSKGTKVYWDTIKKVESYDLQTSLPTYSSYQINQEFVDELNRCLEKYNINTYERICHFIGQCSVESGCGSKIIEQYDGSDPFTYFEHLDFNSSLGNNAKGDGAKYRGAGGIQITGKDGYTIFSNNIPDSKVLTDGALYVGKNYFWAAACFYWSIYKPDTANDDRFNLNKHCDENASVSTITGIVNGNSSDKLDQRQSAYNRCKEVLINLK